MLASLLVVFSALISVRAADLSSEYAHHAVLDPKELMKLYWTVDWDKESVSFAVEAATTGWVGFSFSSGNGKMVSSDMVVGWVKDFKGYLTVRKRVFFIPASLHINPVVTPTVNCVEALTVTRPLQVCAPQSTSSHFYS